LQKLPNPPLDDDVLTPDDDVAPLADDVGAPAPPLPVPPVSSSPQPHTRAAVNRKMRHLILHLTRHRQNSAGA
jgi:hypothetical protein